jgi:hypothetical protein
MKKFLFPAMCLYILISCSEADTNKEKLNSSKEGASTTSQADAKYLTSTPTVYKALETGNFNNVDTLWADDIVDHGGNNGKDIKGKDSVKSILVKMHNELKDIKLEVLANAYDNGYLLTLSRLTATTVNEWNGRPANSKVDEIGMEVVKVRDDGKVTDHWHFADVNEIMKMMSMPKAKETLKK